MFLQIQCPRSLNFQQFVVSALYISLKPSKQQQCHLDKGKEPNQLQGRHFEDKANDSAAFVMFSKHLFGLISSADTAVSISLQTLTNENVGGM